MLPFTRYEFFGVFAAYNAATWPAAIVAYPLAIAALLFAYRATQKLRHVVAAILALMWGWVGLLYHGVYFSQINPVARVFGQLAHVGGCGSCQLCGAWSAVVLHCCSRCPRTGHCLSSP